MPGRVKCGATEREIVVAYGCRKRKQLIYGTEGEIVVAHGRLPSPAPETEIGKNLLLKCCQPTYCLHEALAVPYFHDLDNHYNQSNIVFSNLLFSFLYRKLFKTFSYFKFNKVPYSRYFFYLADFYINKYKNRCKKAKHRLARLLICSI